MHAIDWLIVLILNGSIIGYGFYLSRGTFSSSEWFLGRRALPWWAIGLSMFATNVDNADIVSISGKTYSTGLHIVTVHAIGSVVGGVLAGFYIVPAMYRAGFYTNAEYLEARFGVAARVLSALIQIQYRSSMLGLMLWSVHLLLTGLNVMGPLAAWLLIVVLVVCAGIYTAWGGLKSVVWTDSLQGVVIMIGGVVIFCAVWQAVGGWAGMTRSLQSLDAERGTQYAALPHVGSYDGGDQHSSPYAVGQINLGAYVVVLGWTIVGAGYWTVNHTQTMRLMGARSLWDMKMAAMLAVAISLPMAVAIACLGIFGRALPHLADLENADAIYPRLANDFLGVGLKGLVVAGVVAAAVSTFDSMGSALSAIFTRDIYARLLVRSKSDHHYVVVGRWATLGVLLLGFLYLPFIALRRNMLDAFTTLIPVFVTPLFTLYVIGVFTRVHRGCGLIGLVVGSSYGICALYCREAPRLSWLPDANQVPLWLVDRWAALAWSLLITAAASGIAALFFGSEPGGNLLTVSQEGWLSRSREALPAIREHPFPNGIPLLANPNLYATALVILCFYVVFGLFW